VSIPAEQDWLTADALAPSTGGALAPLFEAAAMGRLALPFCGACEAVLELEQDVCDSCGRARVDWREVAPAGTVHSVTKVHRREPSLIRSDSPYHVLDVQLASGHRLVMTTTRPAGRSIRIGDPVRIGFRTVGGTPLPAAEID
jgi:uncharacterized OB-fold protein